jgi:hypothetical protein
MAALGGNAIFRGLFEDGARDQTGKWKTGAKDQDELESDEMTLKKVRAGKIKMNKFEIEHLELTIANKKLKIENSWTDTNSIDLKGLKEKVVIYHHAFRNALIPIVTIVSFSIVGLFGGSAITESIFVWNGIGTVLIRSLTTLDFNVVLVLNMFYAVLALVANIVMDIGYALVDPRIRLG